VRAGYRRILPSSHSTNLPFVLYFQQDFFAIADKAVELIIEKMNGQYVPHRETMPVTFVADVGYPTREGL